MRSPGENQFISNSRNYPVCVDPLTQESDVKCEITRPVTNLIDSVNKWQTLCYWISINCPSIFMINKERWVEVDLFFLNWCSQRVRLHETLKQQLRSPNLFNYISPCVRSYSRYLFLSTVTSSSIEYTDNCRKCH